MKRLILISTIISVASSCFAQSECGQSGPIFKFDNSGEPKTISHLGSAPEFPFLMNKTSARQVYMAIKKADRSNTNQAGMSELNNMLMQVGFANGAKDLDESSISEQTLPNGTKGNMGSRGYSYGYARLMSNNPDGFKAWKISSPSASCSLYIMQKCGNAFYPQSSVSKTACINVPVNLTNDTKEVTLDGGTPQNTVDKVYVYYHRKHGKRRVMPSEFADVPDPMASRPILLSATNNMSTVPQSYKISVTTPDNNVQVCPDKELSINTNINVEKVSEFTGNYPSSAKNYKRVSKRVYRKTERKMRKVRRKEHRVSALTGIEVNK